jgi:Protein of unknown function (DUF1430).
MILKNKVGHIEK